MHGVSRVCGDQSDALMIFAAIGDFRAAHRLLLEMRRVDLAVALAECLDEYEAELLAFPNGAHDDLVDTASYAGIEITGSAEPSVWWL